MFKRDDDKYTIESCINFIELSINKLVDINDKGLSISEYNNKKIKAELLSKFLKQCGLGNIAAKEYVKEYISDLLTQQYGINSSNIGKIMKFDEPNALSVQDKFDIILHKYKKEHGGDALQSFIVKYGFNELREYDGELKYIITDSDINSIYKSENISLDFNDKLSILTQKIYSKYKGLGVIDDIWDQNINGVSVGVSGLSETIVPFRDYNEYSNGKESIRQSYEGAWIYYKTKKIDMRFISFNSHEELNRIIDIMYKFNNPGQLSESNPAIINSTASENRLTTLIKPFADANVAIYRKFDNKIDDLDKTITGENSELVIKLISFLVKACVVAITGPQGSGKTTLIKSALKSTYAFHSIRMWESFFESNLRRLMPERNIITITETDAMNGEAGLDMLKRTEGDITIVQEAANDIEVSYILKVAMFSRSTIFGHHARNLPMLIRYMRNSALNCKIFANEAIAEDQIVSILDYNIQLGDPIDNENRYISKIVECNPYPDGNGNRFTEVEILSYDVDNSKYVLKNKPSLQKISEIKGKLLKADREEFDRLLMHFDGEVGNC